MTEFAFSREPDDRLVKVRASIGGDWELGFYLVFRGDPVDVVEMLHEVLAEAEVRLPEGRYTDKRGRPQG